MSVESAPVRYFEIKPPVDSIDRVLNCLSLRWATDDGIDHAIDHTVRLNLNGDSTIDVGEFHEVVPFSSIRSVHHSGRSNYGVLPFTLQLTWSLHRFYVNRFYQSRQ